MKNYQHHKLFSFFLSLLFLSQSYAQVKSSVIHPQWSYDQTIYEVNVRQFSEEGTFQAVEKEVPRLKELGIGILWLMPIHPIGELNRKGTLGSYYSVKDYHAVDPSYGTMDDFKSLVKTVHKNGMYLIIDWVANHSAWDNHLMQDHPEFYTRDSAGNVVPPVADWHDVADFNYDNLELRKYMTEAFKFWVRECDIDGYRCDVADMVPIEFWENVRTELDKIKPVFMLAEAENPDHHKNAFDMSYSWEMMHIFNQIVKGEKNADAIRKAFANELTRFPENSFRMRFTSNHDENSWNGTEFERLKDAASTFAVLTSIFPGMPLVYNGQEVGLDKRLEFFEKDPIKWNESKYTEFYKQILNLKRQNKALLNGEKGSELKYIKSDQDNSILAFTRSSDRDKVVAIFNLSPAEVKVKLESNEMEGKYKSLFNNLETNLKAVEETTIEPWGYRVYIK